MMVANMLSSVSNWAVRQHERTKQASHGCYALAAQTGHWAADTWTQSATWIGTRAPSWFDPAQQRRPLFAAGSALGVHAQLVVASCFVPPLTTATLLATSPWVGVTLSAAALGWFVADYPSAAAGTQLGAMLGTIGAIAIGPTFAVAVMLIGMAAGAGGLVGYVAAPVVLHGAAQARRRAMPSAVPLLTRAGLKDWVNVAGLSDGDKRARQEVSRVILAQQPAGLPYSSNPIVIEGNLKLSELASLTQLPEGLSVGGQLFLDGCSGLTHLPAGLSVGGRLMLLGCSSVTELPRGLRVGGDLLLLGCTNLRSLPEGLGVSGQLDLSDCIGLTRLPEGLRVRGGIRLTNCNGLTQLPKNLHVVGNLRLHGCTGLTQLPEGLRVGGDLELGGCTGLTRLPAGLRVGGHFFGLNTCTQLTCLPENLHVGGGLYAELHPSLTHLSEGLRVGGNLNLSGCTALIHLPEGLSVGESLTLSSCTGLTQLPVGLSVRGRLNLYGCTNLTRLPAGLQVGQTLSTFGCTRLVSLSEDIQLGEGGAMLRTLQYAQQRLGTCALQQLAFSSGADRSVLQLPENERYDVLRMTQQVAPTIRLAADFERLLAALVQVPVLEREALPGLCAPLIQAAGPRHSMYISMLTEVCLTPAALRPARVQGLLVELGLGVRVRAGVGRRAYTNVHEGTRDIQARGAVKSLWFGAGMPARAQGAARTFAAVDAFITSMQTRSSSLTAYLKVSVDAGQTHLERARLTLRSLGARPGIFTLDIASRYEAPLAEVVAMLYNLAAAVQEGSAEQTEAKRHELQRLCVAALSDSLVPQDGATHCAQGVVQRLLTPLQGYYPEVRLDAFEPPTEGDFVTEFARDLDNMLKQAAPGPDLKKLARTQASAAFARAEAVYAPSPDAAGRVSDEARQAAATRINKVRGDINAYLEHDDLV